MSIGDHNHLVKYEPAESTSEMFGGNSNWCGPIWFPVNFLIIESLKKFYGYLGDSYTLDFQTYSGVKNTLEEISKGISKCLINIFSQINKKINRLY